jgi:hypothetical protein
MWDESFGNKIAHYLELMALLPNSRAEAGDSGVINFDGGKKIIGTGVTSYEFSDGGRAIYGTGREFEVSIYAATGEKVSLKADPKVCANCGKLFWLGEVKNYCNQCGAKQ